MISSVWQIWEELFTFETNEIVQLFCNRLQAGPYYTVVGWKKVFGSPPAVKKKRQQQYWYQVLYNMAQTCLR